MSKRIAFINFLETVTSFITNNTTVAREWIFPDRDMTVAGTDDVAAEAVARAAADTTLQANIDLKLNRLQPDETAKTDNYTLLLAADNNDNFLHFNIATDKSLTIPLNATSAFPIGYQKPIYRTGAGTLSILKADVSIVLDSTSTGVTDQGAEVPMILRKVGTNSWKLYNGAVPLTETSYTLTTSNVANVTTVSAQNAGYFREGKRVNLSIALTVAKGATGATSIDITMPFNAARSGAGVYSATVNGTNQSAAFLLTAGSAVLTCYSTVARATFAANQTHTISIIGLTFAIQ